MSTPAIIPTFTDEAFFVQVTTIDGVDYTLTFRYNQREDCYYLTIGDVDGTDILSGIKLVCCWDLLLGHREHNLPTGTLMVLSSDPVDFEPPRFGELGEGVRCRLVYSPQSDEDDAALQAALDAAGV